MYFRSIISCLMMVIVSVGLFACGGGSSSSNSINLPLTITGVVTYTSYKPIDPSGLDYASPTEKPVRGAVVELQSISGTVYSTSNTTAAGSYTLSAPENATVRVVVKAALGSAIAPNTRVVDNTSGGALYAITYTVTTGTSDLNQSFNAGSGWNGARYAGTRAAAPFAILDVIYQSQQLVLSADSRVSFPLLVVNWSVNNIPSTAYDPAAGEIGTSFYNGQLYILGAEDFDTDEYDSHVIAHEWGHYFEDKFSRSDSIGGSHSGGDRLDPTVAFGEGFGNALSGMVMQDPLYLDTWRLAQGDIYVSNDLETNNMPNEGFYSETSVQKILYDLYDSGIGDDDSLALGFTPIYNVLVNGQKNTPAFTSIFSFLHYLKQANSASSDAITSLADAENIAAGDEYEAAGSNLYIAVPLNTDVTLDGVGNPLTTSETNGVIGDYPSNKLGNRIYFKYSVIDAGCYTFSAMPTDVDGDLIIYVADGVWVDDYYFAPEAVTGTFTAGQEGAFAVGSFDGPDVFSVVFDFTPGAC